jgi:hypothetical protein
MLMTALRMLVAKTPRSIAGNPARGADDSIVFRAAAASGEYDDADWAVEGGGDAEAAVVAGVLGGVVVSPETAEWSHGIGTGTCLSTSKG